MSSQSLVPNDHPLKIAWDKYKLTEDFQNTKRWVIHSEHVEGSLWATFMAGFNAAQETKKGKGGV